MLHANEHYRKITIFTNVCEYVWNSRSLSISPVRPVSSQMEHTSSQNWFCPECPCSWTRAAQFSRTGRPKRGNLESCGGKRCTRAPWTFPFKPARTGSIGLDMQTGQMESDRKLNLQVYWQPYSAIIDCSFSSKALVLFSRLVTFLLLLDDFDSFSFSRSSFRSLSFSFSFSFSLSLSFSLSFFAVASETSPADLRTNLTFAFSYWQAEPHSFSYSKYTQGTLGFALSVFS